MATEWKSDAELFALCCRELYTPVVGDILDDLGHTHQFLRSPSSRCARNEGRRPRDARADD